MTMTMYQHRTQFLSTPSARRATVHTQQPLWEREISIHALREEGDEREVKPYERQYISIHALREEGDLIGVLHAPEPQISIHALREEGDWMAVPRFAALFRFLSTPSARRATGDASGVQRAPVISIHALREEGDQQAAPVVSTADKFLSTPSARRATIPSRQGLQGQGISIHALREEGDAAVNDLLQRHNISIHALREEGDPFRHRSERVKEDFYPRPPRGGRRDAQGAVDLDAVFLSTPSARRATHSPQCGSGCKRYFYPRPPRGGRPSPLAPRSTLTRFLSTPSARRATLAACAALHADAISIHALREEGDTVPSSETTSVEDFYPRPPRGGRLQPVFQGKNCCLNFYPRPPRGGRRIRVSAVLESQEFLSTPSARRATFAAALMPATTKDFYPRPPRGGRQR